MNYNYSKEGVAVFTGLMVGVEDSIESGLDYGIIAGIGAFISGWLILAFGEKLLEGSKKKA